MGILDKKVATQEEKIHDLRQEVLKVSTRMYNKMERQHQQLWDLIWENSSGLTPQEVLDEYGTDAKDFFIISESIQTLLVQVRPTYTVLETPNLYVINEDGTITVGELKEE